MDDVAPTSTRLLDVDFSPCTLDSFAEALVEDARHGRGGWVCTANVAILMTMRHNETLREYVSNSRYVVADGQPVVWLSRMLGTPLPARVTGVDLVERLCQRSAEQGLRVFLLGGRPEVAAQAARNLEQKYPGLQLEWCDGYQNDAALERTVRQAVRKGTCILFVGMGVPRQEEVILRYREELRDIITVAVGGSIEVFAGRRSRAPAILQTLGLEWLFRLVQEPRRLWRRYVTTGVEFIMLASKEVARVRFRRVR